MESSNMTRGAVSAPEFLSGGGEMGELIRSFDWSLTSLGPVEQWPQSLRTCVRIMLTSRQPIWIGWGQDLIKLYNDPYKTIVGGKHPWALGKPASEVWRDIWKDIEPMLVAVMEKDQGTYVESQLLIMERNGYPEETYYTFSYTPIPGDDGKTAGMFCANSDDTERIISERQLRTLTQLGKNLTDCQNNEEIIQRTIATLQENPCDFPFALFRTIEDGAAVLTGHTPLGDAMQQVRQCIGIDEEYAPAEVLKKAIAARKPQIFEHLRSRMGDMPSGAWATPPDNAIVLPIIQTGNREPYGVLVVGINPYRLLDDNYLSFFTLVADQIATSFADVHVLEEERKRAEALAEIDRAKTTFFSNISHEFRTPLTLLLGPVEDALNDTNTNPVNRERMGVAYRNALRMQKLVNTLLEFSRIEAGRADGKFSKVDIGSLTEDLASTFRSAIERAGMQLKISNEKITGDVYVDVDMWERIILNLVSNAFKYSTQGVITVSTRQEDGDVKISVTDTGTGIAPEHLDKIFDRFHRVENKDGRSQEGTGIGLAMVKELVKLHGGTITVESAPGKGSAFTITLPAGKAHLPENKIIDVHEGTGRHTAAYVEEANKWLPHNEAPEDGNPPEQAKDNDRNTVLLADDNADMRDYVRKLLSGSYNVVTAVDGNDAYEKMLRYKPDLLLSDIMMPGLDGFGLLKKVRGSRELKNTPVIFLSARAGEEAKVEGLDAGADDYLVKPFSARELIVRVSNHIRMNQVRRETEQQFYQMFLQAPAIINVFKGPDHVFELCHPINRALVGNVDFTGMPLASVPGIAEQGVISILDEVYTTGRTIAQNEHMVLVPDAEGKTTERYFNFINQPWRDINQKIQGVLSFAIEVTDTVKSRQQVEQSEQRFRSVLQQAPAIFLILRGRDMTIAFANEPLFRSWGKDESIIGKRLLDVLPELEGQPFPGLLDEVFTTGKSHHGSEEKAMIMKNGQPHEVYYTYVYQAVRDPDGTISGINIMASDITEQVSIRRQIEESERRFRTLAETLPQLVWMTEGDGGHMYTSSRWDEYSGMDASQERWQEILHPEDRPKVDAIWKKARATRKPFGVEMRLRDKYGKFNWFYGLGEPILNDNGEVDRWIGALTNIDDQKKTEAQLEELVEYRTHELQRSNEDLQQFAHVASHDLKEPVRKIKTFAGRLQTEFGNEIPEKGKFFLEKVQNAADRMYAMIEGVLEYSTLNAKQEEIRPVDLDKVMANIETDLELAIQQKHAVITRGQLPTIEGAEVLLYQLFYNLLSNSLKFTRSDVAPQIDISGSTAGNGLVQVSIRDNGIGFEQEYADKIFETFTRLNAKDKYEGTGLGLALCQKIAIRHGGTITAASERNEGATFTVTLPVNQKKAKL